MSDKFLVFIILCTYVINNAFAADLPPLPAPLPYKEEPQKADQQPTAPAKDNALVLPKLCKETTKDVSDREGDVSPSFIDKGHLPALPVSPEVIKDQAVVVPAHENKPSSVPDAKLAEVAPALPVPPIPSVPSVPVPASPLVVPAPQIVPPPVAPPPIPAPVPVAPVDVKPIEPEPVPVVPATRKPAQFIIAPPPAEPPAPAPQAPPAALNPPAISVDIKPADVPAPIHIQAAPVAPIPAAPVEVKPIKPIEPTPIPVPAVPEPVKPAAAKIPEPAPEPAHKPRVSDGQKEPHVVPSVIISPDKHISKVIKQPEPEKPIDLQQMRFIKDELVMLRFDDDDVTLGELTDKAKLEQMSYVEYLKLYNRYLEELQNYDRAEETALFIVSHSNEGKEVPKLSQKQLFMEVSENTQSNNLTQLRVLADHYDILDLVDRRGNNLLHKAAFDNNPVLARWFIMKGVDINSLNYNSVAPIDIAEGEQYWQVFNLLDKAGAK